MLPLVPVQEQLRQVAGVQVTPYSGAPGAAEAVRIRGAGSIGSNTQPLYVVDDVPVFQYYIPDPGNDAAAPYPTPLPGDWGNNPLLSVATADIDLIEVVKGAQATAQYGAQGQNGVVRIRTRRGAAGAPLRLHYQGYGSLQQAHSRYELLGAQEYALAVNTVAHSRAQASPYTASQAAAFGAGTDWQAEVLHRAAAGQEHHVAFDGGTAHGTRYYVAADYLHQNGVVRASYLNRYGLRLNLDQQVAQQLRLEGGLGLSQTDEHRTDEGVVTQALLALPTQPALGPDGQYSQRDYAYNPLQLVDEAYQAPQQRRLLARLGAFYQLLPGFTAELRGSLERDAQHLRLRRLAPYGGVLPPYATLQQRSGYRQWVIHPAVRFVRTLASVHAVELALEAHQQRSRREGAIAIDIPGEATNKREYDNRQMLQFELLTGAYTYRGRYELRASLRHESVTQLVAYHQRWFPGAQATWHVEQEAFLSDHALLSKLDVWAGWGRSSNQGLAGQAVLQTSAVLGATTRLDVCTQQEAGLQIGLWQDRLDVTASAYQRQTNCTLVYSLPRPVVDNTEQQTVRNRGVEVSIGVDWQAGRLHSTSRLAAALNRNRVVLGTDDNYLFDSYYLFQNGRPLASFYGYRADHIYQSQAEIDADNQAAHAVGGPSLFYQAASTRPGDIRFKDLNGDARITAADQEILGGGLPTHSLTFTQQLSLGRFALQAQIDGLFGYHQMNTALPYLDALPNASFVGATNVSPRVRERLPYIPATSTNGSFLPVERMSDYVLQSGNHARLTSLQLACKVWEKGPRSVQLWAAGYNLLVLTKYRGFDPNVSAAGADARRAGLDDNRSPTSRTIALGVRATL
ncbi:TonB-dependent receptor plug domain-containing protein [Hymenobacter busanensis]|nr:TonB-dependent receptor plug domain-containing protein [Hymenobacter busanensis]QHJ08108.1 TonB-dependent receptor plug domain-containing protein [Hymenobacter busanensis]